MTFNSVNSENTGAAVPKQYFDLVNCDDIGVIRTKIFFVACSEFVNMICKYILHFLIRGGIWNTRIDWCDDRSARRDGCVLVVCRALKSSGMLPVCDNV